MRYPVSVIAARLFALKRILSNRRQKRLAGIRGVNLAAQDVRERYKFSVEQAGFVLVLGERCAAQINSSEQTAGARVRQNFCIASSRQYRQQHRDLPGQRLRRRPHRA